MNKLGKNDKSRRYILARFSSEEKSCKSIKITERNVANLSKEKMLQIHQDCRKKCCKSIKKDYQEKCCKFIKIIERNVANLSRLSRIWYLHLAKDMILLI